jgi:V/A-type H+-transporting ATPase subunit E
MSAEKIIQQINKDSESEIKKIVKDAELQAKFIIENARKEAKIEAETITLEGEKQYENIKKIQISKAKQEIKHEIMNEKEKLIEKSFVQVYSELSKIDEDDYKKIITKLMKDSITKIGKDCKILASREIDKVIAKNLGLEVSGKVDAIGGFVVVSNDKRIKINNTFEGIINRKKDKIRAKVGNILFL